MSDRGDKGRPHFSSSVPSGWMEEKGGEEDERGLKGKKKEEVIPKVLDSRIARMQVICGYGGHCR